MLIMLGTASSPALAPMLAHGRAGARVYVLAPSWWEPTDPSLLRCPTVLIRRVPEVPVSAMHTVDGAELWMGSKPEAATPWRLRLDDDQAAALRQLFLRLFWHDAIDETWTGVERLRSRPAAPRPFDVPEPPTDASIRLLPGGSTLGPSRPDQRILLHDGANVSGTPRRLWVPPSGAHHPAMARLARKGAAVVWDDHALPELATDGRSGVALLPGTLDRLRVELSAEQAAEAATLLDGPAAWSFELDVRLGDHGRDGAGFWLPEAEQSRPVDLEQVIDLPDVHAAELRLMDEAEPEQWPQAHPLSLSVRYRWQVQPPRVPSNTKEDAVVGRWRALDASWDARCRSLAQALAAADEHRDRIGRSFPGLTSALMGFARTHDRVKSELESLASARISEAGPAKAEDLLRQLAPLEALASRMQSDQEEAEHEAEVQRKREQQELAWKAGVDTARRELPTKRDELQVAKARHSALEDELADVERSLAASGVGKQARKDLEARRHKLRDELERLGRRLDGLRGTVAELDRRANESFTFRPPAKPRATAKGSGSRFVPTSSTPVTTAVPDDALPEVGTLRARKNTRYLVIETWKDLEPGQRSAQRLGARLVAPEQDP
ncbi:MAG: hypothetical protein AB1Z98_20650 [Nannocystaceae bacterium]